MSLINQMLRDLESRRAQTEGSRPSGALDNLSRPAMPRGFSNNARGGLRAVNWLRVAGIVAGFALLLAAYLWYSRTAFFPGKAPEPVAQTPAASPPAQPVTGAEEEAPAAQPAPQAPAEDMTATALAAQETPTEPSAAELPVTEEMPVSAVAAAPPVEVMPVAQARQEAKPAGAAPAAPREPARADEQAPPRIKKPSVQGPDQLAERGYQEAVEALQNGKVAEAQQSLREALARQPRHHKSRELLTEIYLGTGQTGEAENLLAAGAMLDPAHTPFSKLHARLLAQRDDISGALQVLERHLTDAAGDPEYHALLGALYQRAADHGQAVSAYRTALRLQPGQGVWWMGLAISLEAQQNPGEALSAYRRARDAGNLTGAVLEFVQRKITSLEAPAP